MSAAIDLTSRRLSLAIVVQIEDIDDDGEPVTVRWCGPKSRTGSGMAVVFGPGDVRRFEGRLTDARIVRTVGPLSNHVQTVSSLDLDVDVGGADDDLLRLAQVGRWERRTISAWYVQLDEFGRPKQAEPREAFRGLVDEGPGCEPTRVRVSCSAGLLGLESEWPATKIPADATGWTYTIASTLGPNPWTNGGVLGGWHPATYYVPSPKAGAYVGPVYGSGHLDGVWREVVFYGYQLAPDVGSGLHAFFHVSPQFNCWVEELWWEDTDASALRGVDTDTGDPVWCEAFNNLDPRMGPTGTCVRLSYVDPSQVSDFQTAPYPRAFAKIRGTGYARPSGVVDDDGSIEFLTTSGASLRDRDDQIVRDAFVSDRMLDLGTEAEVFGPDAILAFQTTAPSGPTTAQNYRHMACAVPATIDTTPIQTRAVLADLMAQVGSDLVERYDAAAGGQRLWPRRRRPNPAQTEADWTIRNADLQSGHAASLRMWRLQDDPGRTYANLVESKSATYGIAPETVASGDPADVIDPVEFVTATHDDTAEQAAFQGVVRRQVTGRWWISTQETSGWEDSAEMAAAARSQPIKGVRVVLGWPWLRLSLLDAVEYEIDGLADIGVGHVREIEETLSTQSMTVLSVHGTFFGGGNVADKQAPGQARGD